MIQNKCHSLLHVVVAFIGTIVSKTLLFWYTCCDFATLLCNDKPSSLSRLSLVSLPSLPRVSLVSLSSRAILSLSLSLSLSLLKIKEKFCSKFSPSPHIKPKKNLRLATLLRLKFYSQDTRSIWYPSVQSQLLPKVHALKDTQTV